MFSLNIEEKRARKQRSDKKKECRPTISHSLYETISQISYITNQPLKHVGETILKESLKSDYLIEKISNDFVRDFWLGNTLYMGNAEIRDSRTIRLAGLKKKYSMRLEQNEYRELNALAYSLDLTTTSTAAYILDIAIKQTPSVQRYIESNVFTLLDAERRQQLKEVLKYINQNSDDPDYLSFAALINLIATNFMKGAKTLKDAVDDFLKEEK